MSHRHRKGWTSRRQAARELRRLGVARGLRGMPTLEAIEKALYRHETGRAAVADPIYRELYCMAYETTEHVLFGVLGSEPPADGNLVVRSHKFIPAFVGPEAVAALEARHECEAAPHQWLDCKSALADHPEGPCRLYAWPFGVVMYHLVESRSAPNLAALAIWRRASYRSDLAWAAGDLRMRLRTQDVTAAYVLGAFWVVQPGWPAESAEDSMRILCTPKVLLGREGAATDDAVAHAELVERRLLAAGYSPADVTPFGVAGVSSAYASWSGVVYQPHAGQRALLEQDLVTCELAVQAVWAYCRHINQQAEAGDDPAVPGAYGWRFLRGVRSRLTNPRPQESGQHRLMRNAIVTTSDLPGCLDHAITTLRDVGA
ncbi:hypothetical protein [Longispora albida]|uniref:hypothetical protein n=1 Tax=Longispora albida TaxID=203523 RepID=UPI001FDF9610|nr:hypothetical protein [Longispora albida]